LYLLQWINPSKSAFAWQSELNWRYQADALADQIYDSSMALSDLNILLPQGRQFGSAQTTAEQDRYHGDVSDAT
jgi:hypothetical protein